MNQEKREHATSMVRLSFQPAHQDKIGASEQWFQVMDTIKQEPNFGYVCKGELLNDELEVVLFIAWENAAKPSAAFLSGNYDAIFSPLYDFIARKPESVGTLYRMIHRQRIRTFDTLGGSIPCIKEVIIVRGPAKEIEAELENIRKSEEAYVCMRNYAEVCHHILHSTFCGMSFFRLDTEGTLRVSENPSDQATFVLLATWSGEEGRAEFQNPDIPDSSVLPGILENDFWQSRVIKRLERHGASISSWIYHKADTARDGKNHMVVASEFAHWYIYGY